MHTINLVVVANAGSHQTHNKEQCIDQFHHSLVKSYNLVMNQILV
jgi:hypothetical protein